MPKKELYYLLEKKLQAQNIVISGEELIEGPLSLTIEHPVFYINGASFVIAKRIRIWSILVYTKFDLDKLIVAEGLSNEVKVEKLTAIHSLATPTKILVSGKSSIGMVTGSISLIQRKIYIDVTESKQDKMLSKYLKKGEKGWYYESKF